MTKTRIKAELILASENAATGDVLYTFRLTYPRILLAEVGTHRALSRNTSSSRAIPGKKLRRSVLRDPFIPEYVGAKQKGMQAGEELKGFRRWLVRKTWSLARYPAVFASWAMEKTGVAKQIANRVLEPWMWVVQVVSATDLKNFFKLRTHKDAEPHFQVLAALMLYQADLALATFATMEPLGVEMATDTHGRVYQILQPGEWHLPFVTEDDAKVASTLYKADKVKVLKRISAARAARTSYTVVGDEKKQDLPRDEALGYSLFIAEPLHASPLEHQAKALPMSTYVGNFVGWMQFRKEIEGEDGGDRK